MPRYRHDPDERARVDALLALANGPDPDPADWLRTVEGFVPVDPWSEGRVAPVRLASTAGLADEIRQTLHAIGENLVDARRTCAPIIERKLRDHPPRVVTAVAPSPFAPHVFETVFADNAQTFVARTLAVLLDPRKPYGAALRRCTFDGATRGGEAIASPCRKWFIAMATAAGGRVPKYCADRAEHRDALLEASGARRQRDRRARQKEGKARPKNSNRPGSVTRKPKKETRR